MAVEERVKKEYRSLPNNIGARLLGSLTQGWLEKAVRITRIYVQQN